MKITEKACLIHHKNLTQRKALYRLFKIINSTIAPNKQLTEAEIQIYSEFLLLPQKFKFSTFTPLARKKVATNYNTNYDKSIKPKTVSSYVLKFVEKRFINKDEDGMYQVPDKFRNLVNHLLSAIANGQSYIIQIKLDAKGTNLHIQSSSTSTTSVTRDNSGSN